MIIFYLLRGRYKCAYCYRLSNVKHNKNGFARLRTIQVVVRVSQLNVHITMTTLTVKRCF